MVEVRAAIRPRQASGTDHEQASPDAGFAQRVEYLMHVVLVPPERQDGSVVTFQGFREARHVGRIALLHLQALADGELGWIACETGDAMAAPQRFV